MTAARIEVLCIGTELLAGKPNTHVSWLAAALQRIGLTIAQEATLPDSAEEIARSVAEAFARSRVLLICGGLGPTFDDVTRQAVAQGLGRPLRYHPGLYAKIRGKLHKYYPRRIPPENKLQAYVLQGAAVLPNKHGSAPGQFLKIGDKAVILLPGPLWELQPMFEKLLPGLRKAYAPKTFAHKGIFHFCGISESDADERLRPVIERAGPAMEFTILAHHGLVDFHVTVRAASRGKLRNLWSSTRRSIERLAAGSLFGMDADSLESVIGKRLKAKGWRLAAAESCTAGMLSQKLTDVPGSSGYYAGGIVAYSNEVKSSLLGISSRTLERHGAVSQACAREMAQAAAQRLQTDCGIAITGIAGPGGGTSSKPVGLVFIAVAVKGRPTSVKRHLFTGHRAQIRERSTIAALTHLYRCLA